MLGWRPYKEAIRITLCYEPTAFAQSPSHHKGLKAEGDVPDCDAGEVLVVHQVGHTDGGRFGIFRSESVMMFYQPAGQNRLPRGVSCGRIPFKGPSTSK